jgi:hypothetical protein
VLRDYIPKGVSLTKHSPSHLLAVPGRAGGADGLGDHPPGALARAGLPGGSRSPAITGAAPAVLIVVANGESPLRRICLSAIFVCP